MIEMINFRHSSRKAEHASMPFKLAGIEELVSSTL